MNTSENDQIKSLVEACKQEDKQAMKRLYDTYSNTMYAICLRYMGSTEDAKDALQEGFIKVYKNISKFSFTGSFEGWMKRIFVNTSIEQIRRRKLHLDVNAPNPQIHAKYSTVQVSQIDANKILDLVQDLPSGYRTVFNMYCVDGYSHKEIAAELGVSESTSKSQLFKARKMLQDWLKHWFE